MQSAVAEALVAWRRGGSPGSAGRVAAHRRKPATRWTRCAAVTGSAGWPSGSTARPSRRPAPTTGSPCCACCSPALAPEARLALTLRAVVGLTTPQIARAFLVDETTLAQRIVRAKRKIVSAGIALTVQPADQLGERLGDVLAVVYVMFNEGFVSSTGATQDRDLAADAVWLAGVVAASLPREAEAWGLAALLAATARPQPRALRRGRRSRAAARPGPVPLGRGRDRRGRAADRAGRVPEAAGSSPAPGRDRRGPRDVALVGGTRLAPDDALRDAAAPRPVPCDQARRSPFSSSGRRRQRQRSRTSRRWPVRWRRTTCSTRRAASCSRCWVATRRPPRPTGPRSP